MRKFFNLGPVSGDKAEIRIYGDIVADKAAKWSSDDKCPSDMYDELAALGGRAIDLYINSGGGDVFAGYAMYNCLKRYKALYGCQITAHVDGIAGSIASLFPMVADKTVMPKNAFLFVHQAWTRCDGNCDELRRAADDLERIQEGIILAYTDNAAEGVGREDIFELMRDESWLDADRAAEVFKNIEPAPAVDIAAKIQDSGTALRPPAQVQAAIDMAARDKVRKICIAGILKGEVL